MFEVHEATYVIDPDGSGEVRADMVLGTQKVSTTIPIGEDDAFLQSLLDELSVRIEQIGYLSIAERREIHVTMGMGTRQFVARIPLDDDDGKLGPPIDRLLETVAKRFMRMLQSSIRAAEDDQGEETRVASASIDTPV